VIPVYDDWEFRRAPNPPAPFLRQEIGQAFTTALVFNQTLAGS
jgi:hypothetical protein